jgi:hypothetical protein
LAIDEGEIPLKQVYSLCLGSRRSVLIVSVLYGIDSQLGAGSVAAPLGAAAFS